ncbi:MAG TPA: hypothetical protein VHB78_14255 [Vicinamibacterales bacterium]|jgi:hypothetical protein|nr:hypothetical protein [Vicinamibacterales bacterium]
MSNAIVVQPPSADSLLPAVPWRDPHTVPPGALAEYIRHMEEQALANPRSADVRTCLGMAYAVNYEVYKSMDALETATQVDPDHFWARLKYAELHYRLRALPRAEEETLKAVDLAKNAWQLSLARTQLRQIRKLLHEGTRTVTWNKPLTAPTLALAGLLALITIVMVWK